MMRVLILIVVLSSAWQALAQSLEVKYRPCDPCGTNLNDDFEYGNTITFPTESVISDYGIRQTNIAGASVFHQAIDYTVRGGAEDAKYALKAVNGGTVDSITNGSRRGYKIMRVGGYGYCHIFTNSSSNIARYGKFILAKLDKIQLDEWAIIDLEYCRCFAKTPNPDGRSFCPMLVR